MPLPPVHHVFLQRATPEGCDEHFFLDGRANHVELRQVSVPYAERRRSALEILRGAAGFLLKNAARLVYLAPALVVVKLILYFIDSPTSDLVVVAFVGIVVVFFALLNLYIFMSALWWLFGRAPVPFALELPFDKSGRPARGARAGLPAGAPVDVGLGPEPVGQMVRARGSIVRLGPNREGDGTVLYDLWAEGSPGLRVTEALDFAVVAPGRVPVVLRLSAAPIVVARPEPIRLDAYASMASEGAARLMQQVHGDVRAAPVECALLTLREGDEVEVIGPVAAPIDNVDGFDLAGTFASVPLPATPGDGGASPFRDKPGGQGVILSEAPGAPVYIQHVGRRS